METTSRSVLSPTPVLGGRNALPFQSRSCRPWTVTSTRGGQRANLAPRAVQVRAKAPASRNDLGFPEGIKSLHHALGVAGVSIAAAFVVASLPASPASARSGDIDLPPLEPAVATVSSSKEIDLAKQLQSVGAKMYGAFWCSHCFEQKQMFGKEALKYIEYVECYPEGYRRGVKLAAACSAANIQGFPTWEINGQQYSGEQPLEKLAELSSVAQVTK